jgi:hypothetical protein
MCWQKQNYFRKKYLICDGKDEKIIKYKTNIPKKIINMLYVFKDILRVKNTWNILNIFLFHF